MPKGHLMDSQVAEVEAAVRASRLRFEDVKWDMRDGQFWTGAAHVRQPTLVYWPDQAFTFSFDYYPEFTSSDGFMHDPGGHQVYFLPGREAPFEHRRHLRWDKVMVAVRDWLKYVAREEGLIDPLEGLPEPLQTMMRPYGTASGKQLASAPPREVEESPPTQRPRKVARHPKRERVLGAPLNAWLEKEAERRGYLWSLILAIAGLILAALAL